MPANEARAIPGTTLQSTCDAYLRRYREVLQRQAQHGRSGTTLAIELARAFDGLLGSLFCAALAMQRHEHGEVPALALLAQGSYGRRQLALHSDIDLLFLAADPQHPSALAVAQAVLYPLWDLKLDLGHAVRSTQETLELAAEDVATRTGLLDLRWVAGNRTPLPALHEAAHERFFADGASELVTELAQQSHARHERFGGSQYLLEPEIKLGRGGLRDLDVLGWASKAHWGAATATELVPAGVLVAREAQALDTARDLLWRIRHQLHSRAGRRQDRLSFEAQEEIARSLGFVDGITLGVEQFMQAYYRHATVIAQASEHVLARAQRRLPSPDSPYDDGTPWAIVDGSLAITDTARLTSEPHLALAFYEQVLRRGMPPAVETRQALHRQSLQNDWRQALQNDARAVALFLQLLCHIDEAPLRRASILGELHEVGLMVAMIPEFEPLLGRVQHDVYHIYTVDVHSVAAVDRLRAVMRGDFAAEWPLASRLAAESARRVPLFVALLLHDVGKGRGKNHSVVGAELAAPICRRLLLNAEDSEHVVWLVREHLALYHWATRRDMHDVDTLREAAASVASADRLRDLTLLTVADLSTTNPQAMTTWKARMLDEAYLALDAHLAGTPLQAPAKRAVHLRQSTLQQLKNEGYLDLMGAEAFLVAMPDRYALAHPVAALSRHARLAARRQPGSLQIEAFSCADEGLCELVVLTDDRPGLLAQIAAALAAAGLAVVTAHVYTYRRDNVAVACDVFLLRGEQTALENHQQQVVEPLRRYLAQLQSGERSADALLEIRRRAPSWSQRKSPAVPTEIHVEPAASPDYTLVDVYTRDRVGLLHVIADTLHRHALNIALSKINTEGHRVADVFYVQTERGEPLTDAAAIESLKRALRQAVETW